VLFKLTEYAQAEKAFIYTAVAALSRSRGGIVSVISEEPTSRVGTTHVTTDDGKTVEFEPIEIGAPIKLDWEDIAESRVEALITTIDEAAGIHHEKLTKGIFRHLDTLTAATGNQVDAAGKTMFEGLYEMFEKVELSFEEDGSISKGFVMVAHPETAEKLARAEADFTPEQRKQLDDLIDRKRQDFFARRRRRQLP
jgi:hypothetical protein